MVNTRMEGRVEHLERQMEEIQSSQNHTTEELTSMKTTMTEMLGQLGAFRAAFDASQQTRNHDAHREASPPRAEERGPMLEGTDEQRHQQKDNEGGYREVQDETRQTEAAKFRKLELPLFAGEDPLGWIFNVERYFTVNSITEEEKMDAVAVSLEGKALTWFKWLETRAPVKTWKEFKHEVADHFYSLQQGDKYEQLMGLRQEATVEDFREQFELLSASLWDVQEEVLMGTFKNSLREEI